MIYLVVFAFSLFFAYCAENKIERGKRGRAFLVLASIGPIFLAGLRGNSVGMDTYAYVIPTFDYALKSVSISHFYALCNGYVDVGFAFFVYVIAKIFENVQFLMFAIHIVIIINLLYACLFFKKSFNIPICFSYAIFLFFLYNPSLTIMRQTMAFSISLAAMVQLVKKDYIKFVLITCVASLFHFTILLFVVTYFSFFVILEREKLRKHSKKLFAITFTASFFIQNAVSSGLSLVDVKYSDRILANGSNNGGNLTILLYGFWAILPFFMKKKMNFLLFLPILGFAFQLLGKQSVYITRLAIPYMSMSMFTIPFVAKSTKEKILLSSTFVLQWIFSIYIRNNWCSLPYTMN